MPERLSYRRIRNSLTLEGLVFIVILAFVAVCAVLRNVNLLVVVSGMMFASLLLSWRINRHAVRYLTVARLTPNWIHAGQPIHLQWRATNHSRFASYGLTVTDPILPVRNDKGRRTTRRDDRGLVVFDQIKSGQTRYSSYRVLFSERGLYRAGPAVVSNRFPLPLIQCGFRTEQVSELVVAPAIGVLAADWKQRVTGKAGQSEWRSSVRGPDEDEFFGIRKWRSGDNMRSIHWRSTAKQGQPMVKQFDRPVSQDIAIVLDLFADPQRTHAETSYDDAREICESILSFAATLLSQPGLTLSGRMVIGIAGQVNVVGASFRQSDFVVTMMRELALAQTSANPDVGTVIAHIADLMPNSTPCCVFSPRPPAARWDTEPARMSSVRWAHCGDRWFESLFTGPRVLRDRYPENRLLEKMGAV